MTWNYRIIYHDDDSHPYYGLHEVYYDEGIGNIKYWTEEAEIVGDSVIEIRKTLGRMTNDLANQENLVHSKLIKLYCADD